MPSFELDDLKPQASDPPPWPARAMYDELDQVVYSKEPSMAYDGPQDFPVLSVDEVHDGDTFWLTVDQGLRNRRQLNIRLDGWDCPEMSNVGGRKRSEWEKARAVDARTRTEAWLTAAVRRRALHVKTEEDPTTYDRWVGQVYRTDSGTTLGEWLAGLELAVPWHKTGDRKWYQVYDRPDWLPGSPAA